MEYATHHDYDKTGRGRSQAIWHDANLSDFVAGNNHRAYRHYDDFGELLTGRYTATQATAGTFALLDRRDGWAAADAGANTATQGINVQRAGSTGADFAVDAESKLFFEGRFRFNTISTPPEIFIGLATIDTTVIAANENTADNCIGFQTLRDAALSAISKKASADTETIADVHTLVHEADVLLGFKVFGLKRIEFYVNRQKVATVITKATAIPTALMVPTLVCQSGGTVRPVTDIDWWDTYLMLRSN